MIGLVKIVWCSDKTRSAIQIYFWNTDADLVAMFRQTGPGGAAEIHKPWLLGGRLASAINTISLVQTVRHDLA